MRRCFETHASISQSRVSANSNKLQNGLQRLHQAANSVLRCSELQTTHDTEAVARGRSLITTRQGITKFLKNYRLTGTIDRCHGSGRPTKASVEVREIVEQQMRLDDETTAIQLHRLLVSKGHTISLSTILRCRKSLGWTYRGSAYCQLIRDANKEKCVSWARDHLHDDFSDVIWTDEATVQLESHQRFACRKRGEPPRPKPR